MTKTVWWGVGDTVRFGTSASQALAMPVQLLQNDAGVETGFLKNGEIIYGYTGISAIRFYYRRTGTGNLYLKFASAYMPKASGSTLTEDADSYTVYNVAAIDLTKTYFITVPASAYNALVALPMVVGETLNLAAYRYDDGVNDTYTTDLEAVGFAIDFSVDPATVGTGYCTQTDLERSIGTTRLAELTDDTTQNPITPDSTVVSAIIEMVDDMIDAKAGQVWTVPFVAGTNCTTVPTIIKQISRIYSIYFCFLRRYAETNVPLEWVNLYKVAQQSLDDVSNQLLQLDGSPTLYSKEASMVTQSTDPVINFFDTDKQESYF
jgi:hypothetical protein